MGDFGTHHEASSIHQNFHLHEQGLQNKLKKRQQRSKRTTQLRLLARSRLKNSKALHKLPIFQELNEEEISLLIDQMVYKKRYKDDILCKQDDVSDNFYVIVAGEAVVTIHVDDDDDDDENVDEKSFEHDERAAPEEIVVGHLLSLQFFGESALLAVSDEDVPHRTATVRVCSVKLECLCLHRLKYLQLMEQSTKSVFQNKHGSVVDTGEEGDGGEMCSESASVLERLKTVSEKRTKENKLILNRLKSMSGEGGGGEGGGGEGGGAVVPPPPPPPPPIENDFSLETRRDQEMSSSSGGISL